MVAFLFETYFKQRRKKWTTTTNWIENFDEICLPENLNCIIYIMYLNTKLQTKNFLNLKSEQEEGKKGNNHLKN